MAEGRFHRDLCAETKEVDKTLVSIRRQKSPLDYLAGYTIQRRISTIGIVSHAIGVLKKPLNIVFYRMLVIFTGENK